MFPLPHVHFQPDQIGLLVTFPQNNPGPLEESVKKLLGSINSRLRDLPGQPLLDTLAPVIIPFPPKSAAFVPTGDGRVDPLTDDPFAFIFTAVEGTNGDPAALIAFANVLNQTIPADAVAGLTKRMVVLNWLTSAGPQNGIGTGGPADAPVPYDGDLANWAVTPPEFTPLPRSNTRGKGVEVVILDTARPEAYLRRAFDAWQQSPVQHSLVNSLLGPGGKLSVQTMAAPDRQRLAYLLLEDHPYPMPDHGLFVAGIINTIAPQANLTLIEVLNERGVGDLLTIVDGLSRVALIRDHNQPVVVNCSLVVNLPWDQNHTWYENLIALVEIGLAVDAVAAGRWLLQQSLAFDYVCRLLAAQGRAVIAAAGNEARNKAARPPARFPAAYNSSVGVGAMGKRANRPPAGLGGGQGPDVATSYSNIADQPPPWGLVTLGGDGGPNESILGIYLGEFPNHYRRCLPGWAWWSGTSFAAPIAAGVIAAQLSEIIGGPPPVTVQQAIGNLVQARNIDQAFTRLGENFLWMKQTT